MTPTLLIRLLFAHFFADFILQSDRLEAGKRGFDRAGNPVSRGRRVACLLLHSAIHAAVAYLAAGEWRLWIIPAVIFASHLAIDAVKSSFRRQSIALFLTDQLLHLFVLATLWLCLSGTDLSACRHFIEQWGTSYRLWAVLAAYLVVLKPTSVFLTLFIGRWTPSGPASKGLPDAGKWIGYLERVLILTFILTDSLEGVGFLLAAKSIFRFGELKEPKQIKITEYVLIGTLASFSVATIVGMVLMQTV